MNHSEISKNTYIISLNGLVQGVGFRPFVYQLATEMGIEGEVNNDSEGVKIWFNANEETATHFYKKILSYAPKLSRIIYSDFQITDYQSFKDFKIIESGLSQKVSLLLTPDFAMCNDCRSELKDPQNRRFSYPFITCSHCGPRYSIITKLPYDRQRTTMHEFVMCEVCEAEYNNPANRRFYAQTNSCEVCGPKLKMYHGIVSRESDSNFTGYNPMVQVLPNYIVKYDIKKGKTKNQSKFNENQWILSQIKKAFENGKILAIKGIGGYLLMCDATNEEAVETLRARKNRPTKPFAVLYPNLEILQEDTFVNEKEVDELQSEVAPIVLLKQRKNGLQRLAKSVNPNLNTLGVMLPYSPLLNIIANDFGKPLVATSGNVSGNPIVFEDGKALIGLAQIADFIVTNNRKIVVPQDDSVVRFTQKYGQKIVIRRSRGELLNVNTNYINVNNFLSLGASLKSTFSFQTIDNLYVSQFLGDLESYETQVNYQKTLNHFLEIFNLSFNNFTLFCDAHEGYFSTQLAKGFAEKYKIPLHKIQHHEAHFAAVLAENGILKNRDSVLGVIWDGTGYGTDGNMWGGEFFFKNQRFHFDYFDAILGDKMPREPRISALCLSFDLAGFQEFTKSKFTAQEWKIYHKILSNNTLKTSSVGRLFDGVASLLRLSEKQTFEGEAAMQLEALAEDYFQENGYDFSETYLPQSFKNIPTKHIIGGVLIDIQQQKSREFIAAKFHYSLIKSVEIVANQLNTKQIAFSGGVFQNAILVDLLIHHLSENFELFFHKNLSPNDENISFGQMVLGMNI
jgi:hydrogenase maturation protein HypF